MKVEMQDMAILSSNSTGSAVQNFAKSRIQRINITDMTFFADIINLQEVGIILFLLYSFNTFHLLSIFLLC